MVVIAISKLDRRVHKALNAYQSAGLGVEQLHSSALFALTRHIAIFSFAEQDILGSTCF